MPHAPSSDPVDSSLLIEDSVMIEEETVRGYRPEHYYPVRVGEVLHKRYRVIGKLGYGSASTVWLCHDLNRDKAYVALKVYINRSQVHRELPIYTHINSLTSTHPGRQYIRALLDSFEVSGPNGEHTCLVHEALGMNMDELRDLVDENAFEPDFIRQTLRDLLRALHFLRGEAHIIHTDIQPRNILLGTSDDCAFARFERDERENPMPRKETPSRTIYVSRPMPLTFGVPRLSDLSEARFYSPDNTDLVMPDPYRAPEVILGMPWSYSIDLWGFAMTLWDLLEPKRLFAARGEDGRYSEHHHLAQMIAIMGPPPLDFIQRSEKSKLFWDGQGNWIGAVPIPEVSLDTAEERLEGDEKTSFLSFMRKTLRWRPEDREDLNHVYMDEWLLADLIESGHVARTQ